MLGILYVWHVLPVDLWVVAVVVMLRDVCFVPVVSCGGVQH